MLLLAQVTTLEGCSSRSAFAPPAAPVADAKWYAPITQSVERVSQALVALLAARFALAMIDLRLALLDARAKTLQGFSKQVERLSMGAAGQHLDAKHRELH